MVVAPVVSHTLTYMSFDVIVGMEDAPQVCFGPPSTERPRRVKQGAASVARVQRDVSLNDVLDQLSHATSQGSTKDANHPADTVD
jgi:hypothetical protein